MAQGAKGCAVGGNRVLSHFDERTGLLYSLHCRAVLGKPRDPNSDWHRAVVKTGVFASAEGREHWAIYIGSGAT